MRRRIAAIVVGLVVGGTLLAAPAGAAEIAVAAKDFQFNPADVQIQKGDTVTWTNGDQEVHTVTADDGSFSLVINPGEKVSHTFATDGVVPYFCKIHGGPGGQGMAGTVHVGATTPPATVRLTASDHVATAIAWSKASHPDGADFALLGRDNGFADSLSTGAVQGKLGAPLLLTPSGALDGRVKTELARLKAKVVYLFGGTGAISPAVADQLKAAGYTVRRVAGADRILTAVAAAEQFLPEATSAILVRGFGDAGDQTRGFIDSLAAGSLAASSSQPVLFSQTASLSPGTKAYLQQHPIKSVTVVGGTAALAEQVDKDLAAMKIEVNRVAGFSRADTSRQVSGNVSNEEAVFIDGSSPDSWVDGFAAAGRMSHILLTSGDKLPGATAQEISNVDETVGIVCGTTVSALGCTRAEQARDLNTDFPALGAVVDSDTTKPGNDGASGVYPLKSGTDLCYDAFGFEKGFSAASIHKVSDNSTVVTMNLEQSTDNDPFGCTYGLPAGVVPNIAANPADYNIQFTTDAGLAKATMTHVKLLGIANLLGEAEVPGPGDKDGLGFGFAFATDVPNQLCAGMAVFGLGSAPTAAHIHQAASGVAGPVVVPLTTPSNPDFSETILCSDVTPALLTSITNNPSGFYLNVHTTAFPNGAIRGQLIKQG